MDILKKQNSLIGSWYFEDGIMKKDAITKEIEFLISTHLQKVVEDKSGWDILYVNPEDKSFWELTYPQSELSGGGPPSLTLVQKEKIKEKYLI